MAEILGGRRKAYTSLGDDCTMTRFVKIKGETAHHRPSAAMPADATGTRYKKQVVRPDEVDNLLVSGHSNVKIGRDVRHGKLFQGYWIYSLSFEERATCPRRCAHWRTCYGNGMPFAKRIDHRDPAALMEKLRDELTGLLAVRGRKGILVRLHALGDFFSVEYVRFWGIMLALNDNLAAWGYTAHAPDSEIGYEIANLKEIYGRRFAIRWSNGGVVSDGTVPVKRATDAPKGSFVCPEQMDRFDADGRAVICAACGLCWGTDRPVAFIEH